MSNKLYSMHYRLRRKINYFLFKSYCRLKYPEMMQHEDIARALSYTVSSLKFLDSEQKNSILSSSDRLNNSSIVFDIGGETGNWAMQVYSKYKPNLYIFEPNPVSLKVLEEKFAGKNVNIFPYGVGAENTTANLSNSGMGSSVYNSSPGYTKSEKFDIEIRDIVEVVKELSLETIDLIKINIEGGEYDLVPHMINTGLVNKCKIIRIQFHDWIPNAFAMRKQIVRKLSRTHNVEWSYPLVWESWIRKDMA